MSSISDPNNEQLRYTVTTTYTIISYDETYESHAMFKSLRNIPSTKTKTINKKEIELYNQEKYYYKLPTEGKEINDIHTIYLYKTNYPDYYAYKYSIPETYTYGRNGVKGVTQIIKDEIEGTSIFYTKDENGKFDKMLTKSDSKDSKIKSIKDNKGEPIINEGVYQDIKKIMVFKLKNDERCSLEHQEHLNLMNELKEKIINKERGKKQEKGTKEEEDYDYDPREGLLYGGKKTKKHMELEKIAEEKKKEAAKIQRKINKEKKLLGKSKQPLRRSKRLAKTKRRRCPNETRRNKKTGKCEKK